MAAKQQLKPALKKRVSSFHVTNVPLSSADLRAKHCRSPVNFFNSRTGGRSTVGKTSKPVPKPAGNGKQTFSKETEDKFDQVLEGNFSDLPPLPKSTVRIFLSSTFSDMRAERNALAREAYPKLRDYCTELGLGFQVVDLRWGVTAEATNNHMTTNICLLELENCQKVSVGPNCIAIIGNRYGFCPLPFEISIKEFEIFKEEVSDLPGFAVLEKWYKKDENSIPPAYFLQPITSQLSHFLENSPERESLKKQHTEEWARLEEQMLTTIHRAAISAFDKNKLSSERKQFFLMSVTEHETRGGIIDAEDPNKHGLVFIRELEGLGPETYHDTNAGRYKDLIARHGQVDADVQDESLITSLKKDCKTCLCPANVKSYSVQWQDGGIQPDSHTEHREYLTRFCSDFVTGVKLLIDMDALTRDSLIRQREYYSLYSEILHHSHFCKLKSEAFCGQQETLEHIKDYILDPTNRKPFVIHAQSGAGKTSVLAMAMNSLKLWIKEKHICVIRFLGTSPLSTDIYNVLFSICGQLADITESIMEPQSYRTMKGLAMYLPRFFRSIASTARQPVIIFLDSLDQLEDSHQAYTAWWLPVNLPPNIKLIISTLPDCHDILTNLVAAVGQRKNFVQVPVLPDDTSREIVAKYLTLKRRMVSDEQMGFLLDTFRKSPNPLYLKLLMDQAVFWNSCTPMSELVLPDSVRVAINNLFDKLEVKFGCKFVQEALGLITIGRNGLSEIELEDALSCMDDVMNEIYRFHDPPVPGMIRVPPVMWARLRFDIKEYLVERQSQGQTTLYWYHRQFIEAASERYTPGMRGQLLHNVLFEMFASERGVHKDIVLTDRNNLLIPDADRNTTPQPTTWGNTRKLECLTYHLNNSGKFQDRDFAKKTTYCNLQFLRAKVAAAGVEKLLRELEVYQKLVADPELEVIIKFIMTCTTSLKDPVSCAFNVLAYIPQSSAHTNLAHLRTMAMEYLTHLPKTLLIPAFACLVPRSGEPEKVYDGLSFVFGFRNEQVLFANRWRSVSTGDLLESVLDHSVTLACVDMKTTELTKHLCEEISSEPFITADGKELLYLAAMDSAVVKLHIETGDITKKALGEVFAGKGLEVNRLTNFMVTGSEDMKHLTVSVGDTIAVTEYPSLKPVCQLHQPHTARVTNVHCCSGSPVVVIFTEILITYDGDQGVIASWDTSKDVTHRTKTSFRIEAKASQLTVGDEYHVCHGQTADGRHFIAVNKLKTAEHPDPIQVSKEIRSVRVSRVDQQIVCQLGDSEIHIMNPETRELVKALDHVVRIVSFDVAWDEDKLLIADANNEVSLYNKKFEKLLSRVGDHGDIGFVGLFQGHMLILTNEEKVKIWNQKEFFSAGSREMGYPEADPGRAIASKQDVTCFVLSEDSKELFTLGKSNICRVWSLENYSLTRKYPVDVIPTKMLMAADGDIIAFDGVSKKLMVFKSDDGNVVCRHPGPVMCFTVTKDKTKLIFLTRESKLTLHIYDLKTSRTLKKFNLNIGFKILSAQILLSASERYAVFMFEITPDDYKAIASMWNKGMKLPEQKHPYRFTAVDISQCSGAPMHVYHRLSKVPQLGVTAEPYKGNMIMVSARRWIMFWDIPTGNCDHMMCKSPRQTKMYRPDWLGQDCVGSNDVILMSGNKEYVAVGSQDGYVFVYAGNSGMPAGMKAPSSRHPSPVNQVCFNLTSTLVASACTGGYLKLWEPRGGNCIFSVSVGMELRQLQFTQNGKKLVALTTAEKSHILVFDVQEVVV